MVCVPIGFSRSVGNALCDHHVVKRGGKTVGVLGRGTPPAAASRPAGQQFLFGGLVFQLCGDRGELPRQPTKVGPNVLDTGRLQTISQ
jgi:hypothetical protein